jgi:hypothetical protein
MRIGAKNCILPAALAIASLARAEDAVQAGEFIVEPPTLICLGFEWKITGDDNRNASVEMT